MIRNVINMVQSGMPTAYIIAVVAALAAILLFCLPVHELAHAFVAYKLGDNTARFKGRLTLNPAAHLSLVGTLMMLIVGVGYAKPVPINPLNFKNRKWGMAISSLAGPLSNFLMAWIFMLLYKVVAYFGNNEAFAYFFQLLAVVNAGLMVFNLLPVPPLDGSRIITLVLPERTYFKIMRYEQYIWIAVMVAVYVGLFDPILDFFQNGILNILSFLTGFVDAVAMAGMVV